MELYPNGPGFVLPDDQGYIIHTNHFLAEAPRKHDTEPKSNPDTLLRHSYLHRQLRPLHNPSAETILKIMANHSGGEGAVCCHHNPHTHPAEQYETLATVILDLKSQKLKVTAGGPCLVKPR